MTNEEAERARAADNNRLKEEVDRKLSSRELEQEQKARSSERKQQREAATTALQSGNVNLQEIARQGGSLGRRIEREVRRFEATGRVSSWLAGETLKAETVQNAAQQSAFRQTVVDVISTAQIPIELGPTQPLFTPLREKMQLGLDTEGGGGVSHPFKIFSIQEDGQQIVTINAGTINGIIAGNWESFFNVPSNEVRYVVLKCTTNGLIVTSSTLAIQGEPPDSPSVQKWALAGAFDVLIGAVRGASVKQVVFNNLAATGVKRLTTEKTQIAFQQLPYDNWYAWVVT
jgi:hypothetical protein